MTLTLGHGPLSHTFEDPVVFASPLSRDGANTSVARITDVQSDRFTLYVQEAPDQDGSHGTEAVSWVVLEAGSWVLPDGTRLEVGTIDTTATVGAGLEEDEWALVSFGRAFQTGPVVVSQVQTENDPHWVKTRQQDVTVAGFDVAMEEEDAKTVARAGRDAGASNYGVACQDGATGTGYILYSEQSVHDRFASDPPHVDNADHFVCAVYSGGQWRYDDNSAYHAFTPRNTDILVAAVDFGADAVTALDG